MSIIRTAIIPANPSTTRGVPVHLSYDAKSNRVAYTSGKSVYLRSVDDPSSCIQYTGHNYNTTVATFSPSGFYVASGDESGLVRVWDCVSDDLILKGEYQVISGRINAISWDADSQRIIAVGDGKERYGHCFTYDSGNTVGEISGHTAQVNSVAVRPCRPYRAATVSDDGGLVFLQGPPFKFSLSVRGKHTNFVRDVKFSKKGEYIVSVGADRSIGIYDGKTCEFQKLIEKAHDGGIFGVDWYDETSFVTCAADSTVKRWNVEGDLLNTWKLDKKVENQLLGVVRTKDYVVALALSGDLYYFDETSEDPVKVVYGHQKSITALANKGSSLYTGSYDGRIIVWDLEKKVGALVTGDVHTNLVAGIGSLAEDKLVSVGWDDKVKEITKDNKLLTLASLDEQPIQLAASSGNKFALITESALSVYNSDGDVVKSVKLNFVPSSVAISSSYVVVTDSTSFQVKVFDTELTASGKTLQAMRAKPSFSSISPNEKYLAVGDSTGKIFCYDLEEGKLVTSRWAFHTSRITSISWNEDNDHVIAGSLDTDLIVYSVSKPARNVKVHNTHKEGVSSVEWIDERQVVSGGADACVKFWTVEPKA
ncbi:DEKNAAC103856 [Brettanomyces naardenensis]|uniref:DEKNAAC103856 n=1 Tax=Brettanomyces naardenensis TaxID=13370 RepID=A0A448YPF6_BRENA|nr:DEKNAAC103856 [Brettanomyces naardenensis]